MTVEDLTAHRYARQAGRYSAAILLALADLKRGDYAAARKTLDDAEREIRKDDTAAQVRVQGRE
jgi:Tfp pilus assembly protein PilF